MKSSRRRAQPAQAQVSAVLVGLVALLCVGCSSSASASGHPTTGSEQRSPVSLPWAVIDHPAQRVFDIEVGDDGCDTFSHLMSIQTATEVRITAVGFHVGGSNANCSLELSGDNARLTLTSPQGSRVLVHAPVSAGWDSPREASAIREMAQSQATASTGN